MDKMITFDEYVNDRSKVTEEEYQKVQFEVELIGKIIEAREAMGYSQRELAELTGIKQPAIARIEKNKTSPGIDTVIKMLLPLGYKLSIVPIKNDN